MGSYYDRRSPRARLAFMDAKDNQKKEDGLPAGGSKEASNPAEAEPGSPDEAIADFFEDRNKEYDLRANPSEHSPVSRTEQRTKKSVSYALSPPRSERSSESGTDEDPFDVQEITKMFNPSICGDDSCTDMNHYLYDNDNIRISNSMQLPEEQDEVRNQSMNQKLMLKRLDTVKYDGKTSSMGRIRQSVYDKSLSRQQQAHKELFDDEEPEFLRQLSAIAEQKRAPREDKQVVLQDHEELFFHFLSILALLPEKRQNFHNILDTYMSREKRATVRLKGKQEQFNLFDAAESRMQNFETLIEIPEDAKLLRANTMLLQLYVEIVHDQDMVLAGAGQLDKGPNRHLKYDSIYEQADEMRPFFEELEFTEGLAILDYVQAVRQLKKFKKVDEFMDLLTRSARQFRGCCWLDCVSQCLSEAEKQSKKRTDATVVKKLEQTASEIRACKDHLESSTDPAQKQQIVYHQSTKISHLSSHLFAVEVSDPP